VVQYLTERDDFKDALPIFECMRSGSSALKPSILKGGDSPATGKAAY